MESKNLVQIVIYDRGFWSDSKYYLEIIIPVLGQTPK
jgi:hypothetical protein